MKLKGAARGLTNITRVEEDEGSDGTDMDRQPGDVGPADDKLHRGHAGCALGRPR